MKLNWGFFRDKWLIDRLPDTFTVRLEEHPNGFKFNPNKLTAYVGANPSYLFGTGKMYHEAMFAQYGFVIVPIVSGVPNFDFIKSMHVSFADDTDWLGRPAGIYKVGRVEAEKFLMRHLKDIYGAREHQGKLYLGIDAKSSRFAKMNEDAQRNLLASGCSEFLLNEVGMTFSYAAAVDMRLSGNDTVDIWVKYGTSAPFRGIVSAKAANGAVYAFESACGVTVADSRKVSLRPNMIVDWSANKNQTIVLAFRTEHGVQEGRVIDDRGVAIDFFYDGIRLLSGGESMFVPFRERITSLVPHSVIVQITGSAVAVTMDGDTTHKPLSVPAPTRIGSPVFFEHDGAPSGVGPLTDVLYGYTPDIEPLRKFARGDSLFRYRDPVAPPASFIDGLTYSSPKRIAIPHAFATRESTTKVPAISKVYAGTQNVQEYVPAPLKGIDYAIVDIPDGAVIRGAEGVFDQVFQNNGYFFALRKLSSDSHIPVRVDMEFQIPKWWSRSIKEIPMSLSLIPVGGMAWYSYEKFVTGESV